MKKRRHYLLLEVIISFFLLAICAIPLFYPHAFMLKEEKSFIQEIEFDRAVDVVYAELLEKLYLNEIPWEDIESKVFKELDTSFFKHQPNLWKSTPKGRYAFEIIHEKGEEEKDLGHHFLLKAILEFDPVHAKAKRRSFEYHLVVSRKIEAGKEGIK